MFAVATILALLVSALVTAMVTGWRRHAVETVPVAREIDGPGCYPKAKR